MTPPTDLHEPELEDRLRALLHEQAGTVAGPPPGLPTEHQTSLARPTVTRTLRTGSRRWASVGIAAALLTAIAAGVAYTRPDPDDTVATAAAELDAPIQAAPADTRVLVVDGSRWEGQDALETMRAELGLDMMRAELELRGFTDVTTELTTTELTTSVVYFRPGFENVATDVAMSTSLTDRQQPLPGDLTELPADVVVHLGTDWNPLDPGEVRGEPSTLPYVAPTPSDTLQLGGPWPGPGNETDPAGTPTVAVRSFLTRVVGPEGAAGATVEEVHQVPLDGYVSAKVSVTFPNRSPFMVSLDRSDGSERWTVWNIGNTGLNRSGPMPLRGTGEASYEILVDYPAGTASAQLWYADGHGPTMTAHLDHTTLEAGYQRRLQQADQLVALGNTDPGGIVGELRSLRTEVLVTGPFPSSGALALAYFDDQGAPIGVWMTVV